MSYKVSIPLEEVNIVGLAKFKLTKALIATDPVYIILF